MYDYDFLKQADLNEPLPGLIGRVNPGRDLERAPAPRRRRRDVFLQVIEKYNAPHTKFRPPLHFLVDRRLRLGGSHEVAGKPVIEAVHREGAVTARVAEDAPVVS